MTRYAEKAVDALRDYYAANLQAELTLIESEDSLTTGTLTAPVAVLDYLAPGDNRSPLVQISETGIDAADQRNGLWVVGCQTVFTLNTASSDPSAIEVTLRRYLSALIQCVTKNPTLSGAVLGCEFRGGDPLVDVGGKSAGRLHYQLTWDVSVHNA